MLPHGNPLYCFCAGNTEKKFLSRIMKNLLVATVPVMVMSLACTGQSDPLLKKVNEVYASMSVEERAAQLYGIYPSELLDANGEVSFEKCRELIPHGVGHICQPTSSQDKNADEIRRMLGDIQRYLMTETESGVPALCQDEALSGLTAKGAAAFPQAIGVACSWNPEIVRERTARTAADMRAVGEQLALSPMIDVIRTPHWPRIEESSGEDGYLTAVMGHAFVEGLQSRGFREGVAATTKHFLGYGGANTLSWKEIYEEVLLPHEAVIRTLGTESVMTSYDKFRDEYAVCSDTLINVILRDYMGYGGAVISDYGAVQKGAFARDEDFLKQCAVDALGAGNDVELCSPTSYVYLPELLAAGRVSGEDFEKAVKRVLLMKARAGLLDEKPELCAEGPLELDSPVHRDLAYRMATQSIVLLKNDGTLPLRDDCRIALVGPNANSYWSMLGDYTFPSMQQFFFRREVDPAYLDIPTLLDAMNVQMPGRVSYSRGCDWSTVADIRILQGGDARASAMRVRRIESPDPTDREDALRLAAGADVIVAAMGENIYLSGENRKRNGIRLPGDQEDFVKALAATGKPVVLVVFGGHPQVIDALAEDCAAIVQAWYPGCEGGRALASILGGKVNPSGKLCVSYPKTESEDLFCYNELPSADLVAYPFGYGLSYTTFEYSDLEVQSSAKTTDSFVKLACTVTNTGFVYGDEIVQLYVSPLDGQPLKPVQLKGFRRLGLGAGESARVEFSVAVDQLAWWSEDDAGRARWTVSDGSYRFMIGPSSADLPLRGDCRLTGRPVVKALRDEYFSRSELR